MAAAISRRAFVTATAASDACEGMSRSGHGLDDHVARGPQLGL